jgi:hypothetical protein
VNRTTFFTITLDPFKPWKRLADSLAGARRYGFETVVAMDDRCADEDAERLRSMADLVVPFKSPGYCEAGYRIVQRVTRDFVLLISDDEEPSEPLWRFAANPPSPNRFGIPVIPVIDQQVYEPDVGIQERVFWADGWRWVGGFEGHSEGAPKVLLTQNPGAVVWHFHLEAPREEREAKVQRYEALASGEHRSRSIHEEHPEGLRPIPAQLRPYLPRRTT